MYKVVGIRPGEKLHEQMIGSEDAPYTYEYESYFKVLPAIHRWNEDLDRIKDGRLVAQDFSYTSNNNTEWMPQEDLQSWIKNNQEKIGKI